MSQPPQGGHPPQGPGESAQGGNPPEGVDPPWPGGQGYPPQAGRPGQPPYPPQGYPSQQGTGPQQGSPQPYGGPVPPGGGYGVPAGGPQPHPNGPQPYPTGPYQPGSTPPGQDPKKKRTGLFVLVGAGVLALVLAVAAVAVNLGDKDESAASSPAGASSTSEPAAGGKPSDAVQGFLEAVAANDAARALSFVDEVPTDTTLLTDAALQASSAQAPLSAISVPEVTDKYAYKVPATFTLGDKTYSRDFNVKDSGNGWKVSNGVAEVDVSYQRQQTLAMIVNGVEVSADTLSVVPGTYTFTTGSKWVSWGSANKVTFADEYPTLPFKVTPTLTKAGSDTVLAKTRSAFKTCLAQHKLRPKGCPNRINDTRGIKVNESTVRWRVTKDPFRNAKIELDSSDPTVATANFYPDYRIRFRGTKGGSSGTVDSAIIGSTSIETVADLSKAEVTVKIN